MDHMPLFGLFTSDQRNLHVMSLNLLCWSVFLLVYDYELFYHPGEALGHADALSHQLLQGPTTEPSPANGVMQLEELPQLLLHTSNITACSAKELTLSWVLNWVWRDDLPASWTPSSSPSALASTSCQSLWGNMVVIPSRRHR